MKKMKTTLGVMVSAAVCVLALAGCSRESMEKETSEVRFGFSSVPTTTRTEFEHAVTPSGTTSEQVRWNIADVVTICSDKAAKLDGTTHVSQYEVSGFKSESEHDIATVDNHGTGGGLRWADESSVHKFFAVYGSGASISMSGGVTGASIPATQQLAWNAEKTVGLANMDYAYMVGVLETAYASTVTLPMRQMYTAFQFTVASGDNDAVGLTSFTLSSSSAALAGGFTVAYPADGKVGSLAITPTSTDAKAITVNFPEGFQVVKDKPVTFTVLAMGQTLTNLSITFVGDVIGTRTLALKKNSGQPIVFSPSTKNLINGLSFPNLLEATGEDIIWEQTAVGEPISWQGDPYVLDVVDPDDLTYLGGTSTTGRVISYKLEGEGKTPVDWTVIGYYPTREDAENETNPYLVSGSPSIAGSEWATTFVPGSSSAEGTYPVSIDYLLSQYKKTTTTTTKEEVNAAIAASTFGSGSSTTTYFNLANPADKISDYIVESANSYIVNGSGYFRIPLVMGNGVKNNRINPQELSYKGRAKTSAYPSINYFKDYKNQNVTSPLLQKSNSATDASKKAGTPTSAFLVWEDAPNLIAVEESDGYTIKTYGSVDMITDSKLTPDEGSETGETVYWLNFHVATPTQGNAVIAVMDENDKVMWSYHIWVTNYIPRNYYLNSSAHNDIYIDNLMNRASSVSGKTENNYYYLMPIDLGWTYGDDVRTEYEPNCLYVKVLQGETSGKTAIMKVNRPAHSIVEFCDGISPTYQWGRKDAIHTTNFTAGGKYPNWTNIDGPDTSLGEVIQNPQLFYATKSNSETHWSSYIPANLWNASAIRTSQEHSSIGSSQTWVDSFRNITVVKTIYDPCPVGYTVPNYGATAFQKYDGFDSVSSTYSSSENTWTNKTLSEIQSTLDVAGGIDPTIFKGFYFYSVYGNENSPRIFFPAHGYRSYSAWHNDNYFSEETRGCYWTAMKVHGSSGCAFDFEHIIPDSIDGDGTHTFYVKNYNHFPLPDGCFIRPMQNDN